MTIKSVLAVACATAVAAFAACDAVAQAHVNESESATIYVNASYGNDGHPGTSSQPLRTLGAATSRAENNNLRGVGTRILIEPGVYRESVMLGSRWRQTGAAITYQATNPGAAIISGADVLTRWSHSYGNVFAHYWPYNTGWCPVPSGWPGNLAQQVRRKEMIFVNGRQLTQVFSQGALRPGTFFINGNHYAYLSPFPGTNMGSASVEAAARPITMDVIGRSNVVIRGLVLEHTASCVINTGANIFSSHNVLVDKVQANWNNWGGLGVSASSNVTIQNSTASDNGGVGFNVFRSTAILFSSDEADYNNWRGAPVNFIDYAMGGAKFMLTHGATVQNFYAMYNKAQGLWFDTDNRDITISGAHLVGNWKTNLQIEADQGPITFENSVVCDGQNGINLLTSENFTVRGNKFYNNGGGHDTAQIFLGGNPSGRNITDWQTHQYYNLRSKNVTLANNFVDDGSGGQMVFSTYVSGWNWSLFQNSLHSYGNQWFDPFKGNAFQLPAGHQVNIGSWRGSVHQDYSSWWGSNSTARSACSSWQPSASSL
jgi:hypothetical protein